MNVEKISALEQVKSMLSRAYNAADRQLRNPFGSKESVSSYLLTKIQIVTNEIDAFICLCRRQTGLRRGKRL